MSNANQQPMGTLATGILTAKPLHSEIVKETQNGGSKYSSSHLKNRFKGRNIIKGSEYLESYDIDYNMLLFVENPQYKQHRDMRKHVNTIQVRSSLNGLDMSRFSNSQELLNYLYCTGIANTPWLFSDETNQPGYGVAVKFTGTDSESKNELTENAFPGQWFMYDIVPYSKVDTSVAGEDNVLSEEWVIKMNSKIKKKKKRDNQVRPYLRSWTPTDFDAALQHILMCKAIANRDPNAKNELKSLFHNQALSMGNNMVSAWGDIITAALEFIKSMTASKDAISDDVRNAATSLLADKDQYKAALKYILDGMLDSLIVHNNLNTQAPLYKGILKFEKNSQEFWYVQSRRRIIKSLSFAKPGKQWLRQFVGEQ